MTESNKKRLVVIGAGPAGYPAAFRAADLGLEVTLIESRSRSGGVCLHEGCIPSKTLLHVARVIRESEEAARWGEGLCRYCGNCMPCPQHIRSFDVMGYEGYCPRCGLRDWAKEQYAKLAVKADVSTECGDCEERCPYKLPISERLKQAHELLA